MKSALYCNVFNKDSSRAVGLMDVYHLPWDHGALFIFPTETTSGFWMKNTPIPLELIFLDRQYNVISIHQLKPHDKTIVKCEGPYKYALEVNPGWCDSCDIKAGSNINDNVDLIFV